MAKRRPDSRPGTRMSLQVLCVPLLQHGELCCARHALGPGTWPRSGPRMSPRTHVRLGTCALNRRCVVDAQGDAAAEAGWLTKMTPAVCCRSATPGQCASQGLRSAVGCLSTPSWPVSRAACFVRVTARSEKMRYGSLQGFECMAGSIPAERQDGGQQECVLHSTCRLNQKVKVLSVSDGPPQPLARRHCVVAAVTLQQ